MGKRETAGLGRRAFVASLMTTIGLCCRNVRATEKPVAAFPVTITHAFGETIIVAPPKRIVTLGWGGEDALVALGTVPVGMPRYEQFESGILPWIEEKIGAAKPMLLYQGEIDFEAIAVLKPDAILAIRTNIDSNDWRRLSAIAPTIAYRSGPLQADWQEITRLAGECLGKPELAEKLVAETRQRLHDLYETHSALKGRTFVFGSYFPGSNALGIYLPSDIRASTLMELGLDVSPQVTELAARNPDKIGTSVSFERLDGVETDLLILWFPPGARQDAERQPLFRSYAPVLKGGFIGLDDPISMWVTSNPSVLSIPYGFPDFVARLASAAAASGRKKGGP